MTIELFMTLIERVGLPIAFLILTIWIASRMLRSREAIIKELQEEILRLHEARLNAATAHGERLLEAAREASSLVSETNQTLTLVANQAEENNRTLSDLVLEVKAATRRR